VLGGLFENNLRQALSISGGDWSILLSTSESYFLYALAIAVVVVPAWLGRRSRRAVATDE
jgi:putative tricarboxylic transport membrane protein